MNDSSLVHCLYFINQRQVKKYVFSLIDFRCICGLRLTKIQRKGFVKCEKYPKLHWFDKDKNNTHTQTKTQLFCVKSIFFLSAEGKDISHFECHCLASSSLDCNFTIMMNYFMTTASSWILFSSQFPSSILSAK